MYQDQVAHTGRALFESGLYKGAHQDLPPSCSGTSVFVILMAQYSAPAARKLAGCRRLSVVSHMSFRKLAASCGWGSRPVEQGHEEARRHDATP